tara:strand:- start:2161 stop:2592 length:432 start_codon:yes stop_codon:yes gene_type:complete
MLDKKLIENFKKLLSKEAMKFTAARMAVLENLMSSEEHRECEEIFQDLLNNEVKISRATVYRTLDVLVKYEYIRKLDIGDGKLRYEKKIGNPHHDHMICIETGDIIEFHNESIERIQDEIAEKHGYEIVRHVHQLFVKPIKKK